jgi:NAD(P)-dependent dehydrogenase (short-subunit alcohol dehydrogenase family)
MAVIATIPSPASYGPPLRVNVSTARLEDKTALVTDAATGMGRATTELFARHGARPVLFGLRGEALDDAAAASGGVAVHGDVTKPDDIAAAIAACGDRIDIVVNAAIDHNRRAGHHLG